MAAAKVLRVAASDRPPFVWYDASRSNNAQFYGLLVDLLPVLLSYGFGDGDNTTLAYHNVPGASGGQQLPNGSWTGMMGELTAGRADVAAFPLSLTLGRPDDASLSYSFMNGGIGILVSAKQQGTDALAFLKPFAWQLWLAIIATMLGVAFISWVLSRLSPLGRFEIKRLRRLDVEHHDVSEYVVESANDSSIMEAASTQLGQMPQPRSRSWAVRILALMYGIFCVIVLSSYTANLAAFLTVQQLTTTIDSTISLLRQGGDFAASSGGSTVTYFQNALDPVAAALAPRMKIYPNNDAAVAAVRSGEVVAYLTDFATLQYYASSLPCDVTISGQPFGPNSLTFGLQKNSTLLKGLNNALLEVESNGVLDQLIRKWTTDIDQCASQTETSSNRLNVQSLVGLFYMLLLAIALALLIAASERLVAAFPCIGNCWSRLWASGHRVATGCLPEHHRSVPDSGFSKSALDISRSFAAPRSRGSGSARDSASGGGRVGSRLGGYHFDRQTTADAAAAAVAAADAEELEMAARKGVEYNGDGSPASIMSTPDHTVHDDWRRSTSARSGGGAAVVACEMKR